MTYHISEEERARRDAARAEARKAIAQGILSYKLPYCEGCMVGSRITRMHIVDFDQPLKIQWLCIVCYREADALRDGEKP